MELRCERDVLVEALTTAGRATASRGGSLPVLGGVRAELRDDRLFLTGTDLDLTIADAVTVAGIEDGVAVLPGRLTIDIVRALDPGAVHLTASGEEARIASGRSQFAVRLLPADDFPRLADAATEEVTLDAAGLADALRQVVRAASHDDARPILTGVLMAAEGDGLRLVATDSYRLALRDLRGASVLSEGQSVLVPSKALGELTRLLGGAETVTLRLGQRDATFEVGETRLTTRLIEGEFPNYRQLIAGTQANRLTIGRDPLLDALRRVRLLARESTPVRLALRPDGVELSAVMQDVGQAQEDLDAKYEGAELVIAFNPEYLADGVEALAGDEVSFEIIDALKRVVLRSPESEDYLYLLMPVRVSGDVRLQHLWLTDFRSYESAELAPAPGLTAIVGANGKGKSNLLEAVAWLATLGSFRGAPNEALVRVGAAEAVVRAEVQGDDPGGRVVLLEAVLRAAGRDQVLVNRQKLRRARDLLGSVRVTVFSPDDLSLVKGGPGERRRLLDEALVLLAIKHDALRGDLERVLRQRGTLLRQAGGRATPDVAATLDVWDAKLAELGEATGRARHALVERLQPVAAEAYDQVAEASAAVTLTYEPPWRRHPAGLAGALADARAEDLRRGVSTVGPHRDEVDLAVNGLPARTHASQGEQRSLALALRLATHRVVTDVTGASPVLLLDDVFSELDPARSHALLTHLPPGQALLTTAGPLPEGAAPGLVVRVEGGRLVEARSGAGAA